MNLAVIILGLLLLCPLSAAFGAQDPELISEIVARVNNDIITRADYLTALGDFKVELARQMQQQGKGDAEVEAEFTRLKPTVLDMMIDDLLLEQKARDLGIDVEAEVNQQMLEIAKQNGFKDLLEFEKALKAQNIDPEEARSSLRKRLHSQYVIQREVIQPIFAMVREKDRREFYDKHQEYFTTPGEVTISEIFIPLEGYTATEVEQRARRVVAELRAGQNFVEAVKRYSPVTRASRAQDGKIGTFKSGELKPDVSAAISNIQPGEVTEPIRIQEGYQIIRVDDRKPSTVLPYENENVHEECGRRVTMERADDARKKYLDKLREEAYIKITKGYVAAQIQPEKEKSQ
jgi:parvulin-like peptidyl-prolyl isomerase